MRRIRQILETLFSSIDYTVTFTAVNASGTGWRLTTCDTANVKKGNTITIGVEGYTVVDVSLNNYVDVIGAVEPVGSSFEAPMLKFYSGTLKDIEVERLDFGTAQASDYPLVWVREPFEKDYQDDENYIEQIVRNLRFYMLDFLPNVGDAKANDNTMLVTGDHYSEVIEPLENLYYNRIIPYIEGQQNIFGELDDRGTVRGLVSVGVETENGNERALFSDQLSGVEVRIDLPLTRETCKC